MHCTGEVERLRILHLGFEDHRQPGSGGGSVRTHEICRRLARRHDVTVVTAGWPGARDRIEDGVYYRHVGSGRGRGRAMAYFTRVPFVVRKADVDLVVDDFAAPISTLGTPHFAKAPVIASVQWLFARQKARQYHLPFHWVENATLGSFRHFIAVSDDLADELRRRVPGADVHVIPNGVDAAAYAFPRPVPSEVPTVLSLGRLDVGQKGQDVLLEAFARLRGHRPVRLVVAGDGPDEKMLRDKAAHLGIQDSITWVGRVTGTAKWELLASATVVAMPSRYETFGMVALEALATGTPVVGSDIPCLREVVPPFAGRLVPSGESDALASSLLAVIDDPAGAAVMGTKGRRWSRRFQWERLATDQEAVYLRVAAAGRSGCDVSRLGPWRKGA